MRLVITIPELESTYVEEVIRQISEGYTSGHVDSEHHWTTDPKPEEAEAEAGRIDDAAEQDADARRFENRYGE